ncbi:hypothetical protein EYF80_050519 [Liparis tanakae]|uniref:Uncharacterized protein n=1 Tax=Liparis tanakae TaxID=230148 RepID=A0A4Z2FF00_9TELE|nr:hypothetical protein EYF80_050519 [Liparis tanakae]
MQNSNETRLRAQLKETLEQLEIAMALHEPKTKLVNEVNFLIDQNNICKLALKENRKLKNQLRNTRVQVELWERDQEDLLERGRQIEQLTRERDALLGQVDAQERSRLRKTNGDLEAALSRQGGELRGRIQELEMEVQNNQDKNVKLQKQSKRLGEENSGLWAGQRQLTKRLSRLQLELNDKVFEANSLDLQLSALQGPVEKTGAKLNTNRQAVLPVKNDLYGQNLHRKLSAKSRQLKETSFELKDREQEIEKLKRQISQLVPLEVINVWQAANREQGDSIKALTAQRNVYQAEAEKYQSESEALAHRAAALKKLYLQERMRNNELWATRQTGNCPPDIFRGLQKQETENQQDTKRPAPKPPAPKPPSPKPLAPKPLAPKPLAPGRKKSQPTMPYARSLTTQQTGLPKSDRTVTQNTDGYSGVSSRYDVLPAITKRPAREQAGWDKVFMTECSQ